MDFESLCIKCTLPLSVEHRRREALSGASEEWATADGHAVATILYDLLKAFDRVAYHKPIDAAVRTHFPMRQLKLLLQLYRAARHVELDGVAGEVLRARGIIPGCAFATTLFQLLLVGPPREVRAAHPTVSIRVVFTTSHFSDLEAIPWSRRSWDVQARAWPTSSCKQDAR